MRIVQASFVVCLAGILAACTFDGSGVDFDDDQGPGGNGPTQTVPDFNDRLPVGDVPDGGSVVAARCLIISEYIEGAGNNNKAIELFNCGNTDLDMGGFGVCLVRNADTTCTSTFMFPAATLAPGQVLTACRTKEGPANDPIDTIRDNCQVEAGMALSFNGDDRVVVFEDIDSDGKLGAADSVMDALGKIASQPLAPVWSEMTLRRCNFTPADGNNEFVLGDYFTAHAGDDASDFGVPPTEGC